MRREKKIREKKIEIDHKLKMETKGKNLQEEDEMERGKERRSREKLKEAAEGQTLITHF